MLMAERGGFEPPDGFYTINALAKRRFRPLSHLSSIKMSRETPVRESARRISGSGGEKVENPLRQCRERRLAS
jgi:hypothetical protein